jgi:aspartyl-tRNA(Asn)/glutamyl-tRNA(Gln) amidotransferase subunit B
VTDAMLDEIREDLPELADVRRTRFINDYGMSADDAVTITDSRYLADYYEEVVEHLGDPKAASNIVLSEVLRVLNEQSIDIRAFSISAERISELVKLKDEDKINSSAMQQIFNAMLEDEKDPETLAKEMNLIQVSDSGFLEPIVEEIINNNPDEVKRYKEGKKQLIGFFVGQAMKASKGKANPKLVKDLITEKLND